MQNPFEAFPPQQRALLFRVMQHYVNDLQTINAIAATIEQEVWKEQITDNAKRQHDQLKDLQKQLVECTDMEHLKEIMVVMDYIKSKDSPKHIFQ